MFINRGLIQFWYIYTMSSMAWHSIIRIRLFYVYWHGKINWYIKFKKKQLPSGVYTDSPWLTIFRLYDGVKAFSRKRTSNFWVMIFPKLAYVVPSSHDAEQGSEPHLPVSHVIMGLNNPYTYLRSLPTQPFCFSCSVHYAVNYVR